MRNGLVEVLRDLAQPLGRHVARHVRREVRETRARLVHQFGLAAAGAVARERRLSQCERVGGQRWRHRVEARRRGHRAAALTFARHDVQLLL